ncbi:hypothetical protein ONZ45_g9592 [Pleurotus djamor]|nr:hypothetical protein ONZ45_g9592 [Pleurotus djamor]
MLCLRNALLLATTVVAGVTAAPALDESTVPIPEIISVAGLTPPTIPSNAININNNTAMLKKMKDSFGWDLSQDETITPNTSFQIQSGPCDQGNCPDFDKPFDMVFTWFMQTTPSPGGAPPITISTTEFAIRVNDCNQCLRHKVGSISSGCYDFTACGRPQSICVDDGNSRGHRIWKDTGVKTCYRMPTVSLGDCGFIVERLITRPDAEVPCNW